MFAWTRATEVMSTRSKVDFEWSIELIGTTNFLVGIATQILRRTSYVYEYDEHAILYESKFGSPPLIRVGNNILYSGLSEQKDGDIIHFRFRPSSKKLVIEMVRGCFKALLATYNFSVSN